MGEPCPRPGMGVFHSTFSDLLHLIGGVCPATAMPLRSGPRHQGQSERVTVMRSGFVSSEWRQRHSSAGTITAIRTRIMDSISFNLLGDPRRRFSNREFVDKR